MFALSAIVLLLASCGGGASTSENKTDTTASAAPVAVEKKEEAWQPVDSATEMKAWMEYSTPGESHKEMAKSDGSWTGQTTMWMSMDAPPMTSTSTMVNKMIMGGRYQQSTYSGNFMGMPFEGMSITGYDNYKKKYLSSWIDNMGTGIMNMEGTWDATTKTIAFTGKCTNPANGKEYTMREVFTMVDENNHKMEMYGPDSKTGKEYKTMEIVLTKKK
ncbi:hypothetical protein FLA_2128 [Filimonas lacunae]|nr:hypothetical protein FLA_2128 [Filimonas lacunae]